VARESFVLLLTLLLCGPLVAVVALLPSPIRARGEGEALARACARRVLLPLALPALVFAAIVGWALEEESAPDERLTTLALALAIPFAFVVARAIVRALLSLTRATGHCPARTVGLFRPRVVIASELAAALDERELAAVREHEAAHARHRDPLRLLGMQLAADLQWPVPVAARRLVEWRAALELARDDEARRHGVEGEDLASGILTTARLMTRATQPYEVGAVSDMAGIRVRTERLLRPIGDARDDGRRRRRVMPVVCAAAFACAMLLGAAVGDEAIGMIPGVAYYVAPTR
jgi:hypothetical protein